MEVLKTIDLGLGAPCVTFYTTGLVVLEGESRPEDSKWFYEEIMREFNLCNYQDVSIHLKFDYISSSSTICIINFLEGLNVSNKVKAQFMWFYDEIDEDMMELGEIIFKHHNIRMELKMN